MASGDKDTAAQTKLASVGKNNLSPLETDSSSSPDVVSTDQPVALNGKRLAKNDIPNQKRTKRKRVVQNVEDEDDAIQLLYQRPIESQIPSLDYAVMCREQKAQLRNAGKPVEDKDIEEVYYKLEVDLTESDN